MYLRILVRLVAIVIPLPLVLCCLVFHADASEARRSAQKVANDMLVSPLRLWRCPKCGMVLEKSLLGRVWQPGDPISNVSGTGTCSKCGSKYPQADIYGGRYDIHLKAKIAQTDEKPKTISVIVFQESGIGSLEDAHGICLKIQNEFYPAATLAEYYVIQHRDKLTLNEAFINYTSHVKDGALPSLGEQFNARNVKNPNGEDVVALFFK